MKNSEERLRSPTPTALGELCEETVWTTEPYKERPRGS